ncbi:MAG: hypothetical protein ACI9W6_002205, partial [Motiliproteus sp.]
DKLSFMSVFVTKNAATGQRPSLPEDPLPQ